MLTRASQASSLAESLMQNDTHKPTQTTLVKADTPDINEQR